MAELSASAAKEALNTLLLSIDTPPSHTAKDSIAKRIDACVERVKADDSLKLLAQLDALKTLEMVVSDMYGD